MALTTTRTDPDASPPAERPKKPQVRPRPIPELLLVVGLFLVYKLGRVAADGHVSRAFDNAHRVWNLERLLHLPSEASVQHLMLSSDFAVHAANVYYATVHFPASVAFLLWVYIARPGQYLWLRRLMAATTGLALAVHLVFPLAPPRMLAGIGLIDTATKYGPSVYGPPSTDTLSNQYAAMPSLHVGWALIVAIGLIATTRGRWRWLWLTYPMVTVLVVVGTANHYWLDGIAGTAIVCALLPLVRRITPIPALDPPKSAESAEETAPLPRSVPAGSGPIPDQRNEYDGPVPQPQQP